MLLVAIWTLILKNRKTDCPKIRQWRLFVTTVCLFALPLTSSAQTTNYEEIENILILKELNPYKKAASRGLSNFVTDDSIEPLPLEQEIWLQEVFVADRAGVLDRMQRDFEQWQKIEEFRENWDVGTTGLYNTPDMGQKKAYFMRTMLQYADKRLSGEIKNSAEGSTLHRIGQVEQALTPKVEAKVASNIKIKIKARVLQRTGTLIIDNPYVEYHANINTSGRVGMHMRKELKQLGVVANVDYEMTDGVYVARVSRPITDRVNATVSSAQSDSSAPFSGASDKTIQLNYSAPFP